MNRLLPVFWVFICLTMVFFSCGKINVTGLDEEDFDGTSTGPSFSGVVLPEFSNPARFDAAVNCATAGCHDGSVDPLLTGTAAAVHQSILSDNAVNLANEENSTLLLAPLAGSTITHNGQKAFNDNTNAAYVDWLNWIREGAVND